MIVQAVFITNCSVRRHVSRLYWLALVCKSCLELLKQNCCVSLTFLLLSRAFIAQFPICIVAFAAVTIVLDMPAEEDTHWKDKLRRIDFAGAIVLIGAVLGFLVGLDRGSNVSWSMPLTIVSLSISTVLFILFAVIEVYFAAEPFAPGQIIFNRTFFANYACNFAGFGGWLAALFYIPLYFQAVDGVSATVAGLRLLPSICASVSGSLFAGFVMKWTGKYYWLTVIGYAGLTLGLTGIFLFSGGAVSSTVPMILAMVVAAFGNGVGITTTLIALSEPFPLNQIVPFLPCLGLLTESSSIKRKPRGPSGSDCRHISLPFAGVSYRPLSVIHYSPTTPSDPAALCLAQQQGHRQNRGRCATKSRIHQNPRSGGGQDRTKLLWLVNQQRICLYGCSCGFLFYQQPFHPGEKD